MIIHVEKVFFLPRWPGIVAATQNQSSCAPALPSYSFAWSLRMETSFAYLQGESWARWSRELNLHPCEGLCLAGFGSCFPSPQFSLGVESCMAHLCMAAGCRGHADTATGQLQKLLGFSREIVGNIRGIFFLERATRWSKIIPGAPGFDISLFLSKNINKKSC